MLKQIPLPPQGRLSFPKTFAPPNSLEWGSWLSRAETAVLFDRALEAGVDPWEALTQAVLTKKEGFVELIDLLRAKEVILTSPPVSS